MDEPLPHKLQYTEQPRRRFKVPWGAVLLLLAAGAFAAFGPALWGKYLYVRHVRSLQTRCLRYTAPVDKVIYDSDPADRNLLLKQAGYRPFNQWAVFTTPADWHDFRSSYACPDGTAFVHGRVAGGVQRLVAVDLVPTAPDVVWLKWSVSDRTPVLDSVGIERSRKTVSAAPMKLDAKGRPLRIYAGQVDPVDDSRFTIHGRFGSDVFQIDGQLLADGSVNLQPHPPAAGVAAMAGVSCPATGPSGPGFDTPAGLSACNSGKH